MEHRQVERKLAAVLSADAVGYSRLMAEDEAATVESLHTCRSTIASFVSEHRGRIVDSPGDNLLAEFPSATDAVACALDIQTALLARNADLPLERRMAFRIGLHMGDVIVENERIYGNGVNIAARLEALAEPGGICVSGPVHDQVRRKLSTSFEDLGERALKNIPEPVRVYRLRTEPRTRHPSLEEIPVKPPEKPSIAVLPFDNMSGDPDQEYFADGITEDLVTGLSKISGLFVIARNSAFVYKGQSKNVKDIGRELGVAYLVEGSVRKAGEHVRITAQLIESSTGHHLWAERYDRKLEDIFVVQDDVTERIIAALKVRLTEDERATLEQPPTGSLEAYDLYLRGLSDFYRITAACNVRARENFERSIALDPAFAAAHSMLAMTYLVDWTEQWAQRPETLERPLEIATRAVGLDDKQSLPHAILGFALNWHGRRHDEAIAEGRRAVRLNPNDADAHRFLGNTLSLAGQPEEAIPFLLTAVRLDPHNPLGPFFIAEARYLMGRIDEAIPLLRRTIEVVPDFVGAHNYLAVCHVERGETQLAEEQVREIRRIVPGYSVDELSRRVPFRDPTYRERMMGSLRRAGLS